MGTPHQGSDRARHLIPWAEENGDIVALNAWVMEAACCEAELWSTGLQLAVNCSIIQLRQGEASKATHACAVLFGAQSRQAHHRGDRAHDQRRQGCSRPAGSVRAWRAPCGGRRGHQLVVAPGAAQIRHRDREDRPSFHQQPRGRGRHEPGDRRGDHPCRPLARHEHRRRRDRDPPSRRRSSASSARMWVRATSSLPRCEATRPTSSPPPNPGRSSPSVPAARAARPLRRSSTRSRSFPEGTSPWKHLVRHRQELRLQLLRWLHRPLQETSMQQVCSSRRCPAPASRRQA